MLRGAASVDGSDNTVAQEFVQDSTDTGEQVKLEILATCAPQKYHRSSRSPFFQPIFVVQPAKDILDSDLAIGW